jgi:tripartite-type tricarboxylate transporter receptor subunit TctC
VASWGYMVPRGTPEPIVKKLQDAIAKAIATPGIAERLRTVGATATNAGGGEIMTAKIRGEISRWEPVISAANIKAE